MVAGDADAKGAAVQKRRSIDIPLTDDPEEHRRWAAALWRRMDRDESGTITKEELNCETFQNILRDILAPKRVGKSTSTYARAAMNVTREIDFLMRKADINSDGSLQFDEFSSFVQVLRENGSAGDLIFALFDLDGNEVIDHDEFLEIYRYFLGHRPTVREFEKEWSNLDVDGKGVVSLQEYNNWLRTNSNPIFQKYTESKAEKKVKIPKKDADSLILATAMSRNVYRPAWNQRFNTLDPSVVNQERQGRNKIVFSTPQSEAELGRWFSRRIERFGPQYDKLVSPEPPHPLQKSLISGYAPPLLPGRHVPDGTMRNKHGEPKQWHDYWQTPKGVFDRPAPGSLLLRCFPKDKAPRPPQSAAGIQRPAGMGGSLSSPSLRPKTAL